MGGGGCRGGMVRAEFQGVSPTESRPISLRHPSKHGSLRNGGSQGSHETGIVVQDMLLPRSLVRPCRSGNRNITVNESECANVYIPTWPGWEKRCRTMDSMHALSKNHTKFDQFNLESSRKIPKMAKMWKP